MIDSVKLTKEEHDLLISLQTRFNELTLRYGELHYQMRSVKAELIMIEAAFDELEKERFQSVTKLQNTYGVGSVNLTTGEFTPTDLPQATDTP